MATEKQIAANRRNAQNSTGPRTRMGKLKSSINALRHGLYSEKYIIKTEDEATFKTFAASFLDEFDPQTPSELELVDILVQTAWRRRRVAALIAARLNQSLETIVAETPVEERQPEPPAENPQEQSQSAETLTLRAYAHAEKTDPRLFQFEIRNSASCRYIWRHSTISKKSPGSGTRPNRS